MHPWLYGHLGDVECVKIKEKIIFFSTLFFQKKRLLLVPLEPQTRPTHALPVIPPLARLQPGTVFLFRPWHRPSPSSRLSDAVIIRCSAPSCVSAQTNPRRVFCRRQRAHVRGVEREQGRRVRKPQRRLAAGEPVARGLLLLRAGFCHGLRVQGGGGRSGAGVGRRPRCEVDGTGTWEGDRVEGAMRKQWCAGAPQVARTSSVMISCTFTFRNLSNSAEAPCACTLYPSLVQPAA